MQESGASSARSPILQQAAVLAIGTATWKSSASLNFPNRRTGRQAPGEFRGAEAAIAAARTEAYRALRLDTLPEMQTAIVMYRHLGFRAIRPYRPTPCLVPFFSNSSSKLYPHCMSPDQSPGRILGIGGIFFKSLDHNSLRSWYQNKLGINSGDFGGVFKWRTHDNPECERCTIWSIFPSSTAYFNPSESPS